MSNCPSLSPCGTVTLMVDGKEFGSSELNEEGQATFKLADVPSGEHVVTARYHGGPNFAPASSPPLNITLTEDAPA